MSVTITGSFFLLLMASILFPFLALFGALICFAEGMIELAFFLLLWWIIWAE